MSRTIRVRIAQEHGGPPHDETRLRAAVGRALAEGDIERADISPALIDDPAMQVLNRRWLEHDYPTDVLSFVLEHDESSLEGEVIVSVDTARRQAERLGVPLEDELLLYVVHGMLHLVGYDDHEPLDRAAMQACQLKVLADFGVIPRYDSESGPA